MTGQTEPAGIRTRAVPLADLATVVSGFAFKPEYFNTDGRGLPLVRNRDVARGRSLTHYDGPYSDRFLVGDGDYLVAMDARFTVGRWLGGPALLNQRVCRITEVAEHLVGCDYLARFLSTELKRIEAATPFATVRHLSARTLRALAVPLPPRPVQRRVAAALNQADELAAARRQTLGLLDELDGSVFREMFGDPVRNERGWPVVELADVVAGFESGRSFATDRDGTGEPRFRVLKVSSVTSGRFDPDESKPVPDGHVPRPSHLVRTGDLLFSRANTAEHVGATALVEHSPDNLLLPDKLWRFVWRTPADTRSSFFHHLLRQPGMRDRIRAVASGSSGSMKSVSQRGVLGVRCVLPPGAAQAAFAERVAASQRVRQAQREHLRQLEALFGTLEHRAFEPHLDRVSAS